MKWEKTDWQFPPDLGCLLVVPLVATLAGFIVPLLAIARQENTMFFLLAITVSAMGVFLLFLARLPLYREKRFFCLGSSALPESHRKLYRAAWKIILVGLGMLILLNIVMRI